MLQRVEVSTTCRVANIGKATILRTQQDLACIYRLWLKTAKCRANGIADRCCGKQAIKVCIHPLKSGVQLPDMGGIICECGFLLAAGQRLSEGFDEGRFVFRNAPRTPGPKPRRFEITVEQSSHKPGRTAACLVIGNRLRIAQVVQANARFGFQLLLACKNDIALSHRAVNGCSCIPVTSDSKPPKQSGRRRIAEDCCSGERPAERACGGTIARFLDTDGLDELPGMVRHAVPGCGLGKPLLLDPVQRADGPLPNQAFECGGERG